MKYAELDKIISRHPGIQFEDKEIALIFKTIQKVSACNLLVFGMGNDSALWVELNKYGRTVFIEDDVDWYNKILGINPSIEACLVVYKTRITEWQSVVDEWDVLELELPQEIMQCQWDVVVVDGPVGNGNFLRDGLPEPPGRMSSIYMASQLVKEGGFVLVHDCNRPIEKNYADRYLFDVNLCEQTDTEKKLRLYNIKLCTKVIHS